MADYCEPSDLFLAFGETTTRKWADVENTKDKEQIDARIAWAITGATEEINDRLRNGPYEIPVEDPGSGGAYPVSLVRMTALLAVSILYDARGVIDEDDGEPANLRWARRRVDKWCQDVITRRVRLDLDLVTTDVPFNVLNEDINAEEIDPTEFSWSG
jgi:hypothetical protein